MLLQLVAALLLSVASLVVGKDECQPHTWDLRAAAETLIAVILQNRLHWSITIPAKRWPTFTALSFPFSSFSARR
jgi:hypothetical protein